MYNPVRTLCVPCGQGAGACGIARIRGVLLMLAEGPFGNLSYRLYKASVAHIRHRKPLITLDISIHAHIDYIRLLIVLKVMA